MTWLYLILFLAGGATATIDTGRMFRTLEQCEAAGVAEVGSWQGGGVVRGFGCLNVKEG